MKRITKDGYEGDWIRGTNSMFSFSTSNSKRFVSDSSNPVVYTLRKKGNVTFLFREIELDFEIPVGKSVQTKGYDFITRNKIRDVKRPMLDGEPLFCDFLVNAMFNTNSATWSVILSTGDTNGGVIVSEQLLYEAPQDGYQSQYKFVPEDQKNMTARHIYIKSRDPAIYTCYDIEYIGAGKEFFRLSGKSVTNPYGDRNFEGETDVPYEVTKKLTDEAKAAFRQGKRPEKPDLPKMIREAKEGL